MSGNKTSFRQKTGLIIFGVILGLCLLECLLRAGGYVFLSAQERLNRRSGGVSAPYTILCVGDSFTAGIGVSVKGRDYPRQLEEMLNSARGKGKFRVVNKGIPGQNSSELLYSLKNTIAAYTPDIVVVMTGMNDNHNSHLHEWALGRADWGARLRSWRGGLRVYKLFQCAREKVEPFVEKDYEKEEGGSAYNEDGFKALLADAEELLKEGRWSRARPLLLKIAGEDQWGALNLAVRYRDYEAAEQISGKDPWLMAALGEHYQSEKYFSDAEKMFRAALRRDPGLTTARYKLAELYLRRTQYADFESVVREEMRAHGESLKGHFLLMEYYRMRGDHENMAKAARRVSAYQYLTYGNILGILKTARDKNARPILMNYPEYDSLPANFIRNMYFVDNRASFRQARQPRTEIFAADNLHCNEKGYRIIARNVFDCIMRNNLI